MTSAVSVRISSFTKLSICALVMGLRQVAPIDQLLLQASSADLSGSLRKLLLCAKAGVAT